MTSGSTTMNGAMRCLASRSSRARSTHPARSQSTEMPGEPCSRYMTGNRSSGWAASKYAGGR